MTLRSRLTPRRVFEGAILAFLALCALISVLTTVGIALVLVTESAPFFAQVSPFSFLFGTVWAPLFEPRSFGVAPLLCGTFFIAGVALAIAAPAGIATALLLSEYLPGSARQLLKPVLEILAGVPSVVYGYFALHFITPSLLRPIFPEVEVFNAASASIVLAIMILPTICSLCDDAFRAVPRSLREGAHALAATRFEVSAYVVLPAALPGVTAALLLALARAVGETMAVALAAGMTPKISLDPFTGLQTMTAYIVQVSLGDVAAGSIEYHTIYAVGLTLFAITLAINVVAQWILARLWRAYE